MKIEKNIPVSKAKEGNGKSKIRYPFDELEVGDSFFVDDKNVNKISAAARNWAKRNMKKVVVRNWNNGVRVWRTE